MARMTSAQWTALWTTLPGLAGGRYHWITAVAGGCQHAATSTATTFGMSIEHTHITKPGVVCAVDVYFSAPTTDKGFNLNNVRTATMTLRDPVVCPGCGLKGSLTNGSWVAG